MELNCAVCFRQKKLTQQKSTTECQQVQKDLTNLQQLNTKEDLIKAYPDRFEGIGCFPDTYHIIFWNDTIPVAHAPLQCPITMWPLVHEKLNEFLEQGIMVPVEEPMDWVSSLAYSWKANGKLKSLSGPKRCQQSHQERSLQDNYKRGNNPQLAGSKKFTKVDGTSSYLCIVLDYTSSLLTMFNTPWGRYRFVCLPWGLTCAQDIFQWMMDQILECCEGAIGIADDVVIHRKDHEEHNQNLHRFI